MRFGLSYRQQRFHHQPHVRITAVCLALLTLWLNLVILLARNECGLLIPHEHTFTGPATPELLAQVEQAEQACHAHRLPPSAIPGHTPSTSDVAVMHVVNIDWMTTFTSVILAISLPLGIAVLAAIDFAFLGFEEFPDVWPHFLSVSPPTPPPKYA